MQPKKSEKPKRKPDNEIAINQCRLYKVGSFRKLSDILKTSPAEIMDLLVSDKNYKKFTVSQSANPFTGKPRKQREVQEPKSKLRRVHNRVLALLRRVGYPDYVQGAVRYRSYQTNAALHIGSRQTATFDISDFYGSTKRHLVHSFFHDVMKCPTDIAGKLARLTTCDGVIPTGSPLSPLLSFWVAKGLFDECAAVAKEYGMKFSCYIDDLTFSGDRIPRELKSRLKIICRRYRYRLKSEKTKVFRFGEPAHITGVIKMDAVLSVPFARLMAVRKLMDAIEGRGDSYGYTVEELKRKLAGTVSEAASIDGQFKKWALHAKQDAKSSSRPSAS
ncbi:reverse transcriptase family protein [Pseudomonas aeruginosa]|uniref:reverse transcriptase family protein n=1 Tax=Pseudomonas aeruginosa TaxID=287 RepID=UPI0002C694F6|nr:reverse transcriptase family protein [Pseudomonas aeruginosa]AGI82772.1 hypothetical protein G655_19280 [Pseudomonas aeruginosa B136-33]NPS91695.1 RNA-directed DNA polymerase [Pseudomonas aeruginosa]